MSHDLFDAQLTPLGLNQVDGLQEHVKKSGLAEKIELVISSPLLRTMQTAVGVFGGEKYTDGVNAPPLMVETAGRSGRPAVSSLNCPPFVAVETCREHLGVHPCDKRRSITEYRPLFPAIDFLLIENDEHVLWEPDVREANEAVALRGMKFMEGWLWTREEKEIAIASHSGFLFHTLSMYSKECHRTIRDEVSKLFANCELRSIVLVDRSMLGSYSPRLNYPGKIPAGLDLPSDIADKKHLEEAQKN
ncbi:phosphoglycerate mutase-like protein 1 isoform X2 [Miscanthus floridulus]